MYLISFFLFILGAIIGSFLNVVALRFNTGRSFVTGRSGCFSCGKTLSWYENIPLVSFIFLRGKCSGCKTKISWQYPVVELATALIFLFGFLHFQSLLRVSFSSFLISYLFLILTSIFLIPVFIYDLWHKIIPNEFVYPFIIVSGVSMFFPQGTYVFPSLLHLLAGPLLFLPFFLLWLVSGGRWIGFADSKLAWGIGWSLGFISGVSAIALSFWIGALWAIGAILIQRLLLVSSSQRVTMKSEVPFGPFMIIAFFIAFFFSFDFFGLSYLLL
ncbi:MAG: hypothetical protein RJA61_629 [Candidatus Parcubacteria bacterium]|jgi:leader peptidase (prepilin peptidase)/N-methyltransferase